MLRTHVLSGIIIRQSLEQERMLLTIVCFSAEFLKWNHTELLKSELI